MSKIKNRLDNKLPLFISQVKERYDNEEIFRKSIERPVLFFAGLKELNSKRGAIGLKNRVVRIVTSNLKEKMRILSGEEPSESFMMHSLFDGGPGCGKTMFATIIAKIVVGMGFVGKLLNNGQEEVIVDEDDPKKDLDGMEKMLENAGKEKRKETMIWICLIVISLVVAILLAILKNFGKKAFFVCLIFVLVGLAIFYFWWKKGNTPKKEKEESKGEGIFEDKGNLELDGADLPQENYIKIFNGAELQARFVGHSAKNMMKLIRSNFYIVIFIDEAYSLVRDEKNFFGKETLDALCDMMTRYKDKCCIFFGGYRELIEDTIMTIQPGLRSRIPHCFPCDIYSAKDLALIYIDKLIKGGWKISADLRQYIFDLFEEFPECFPNYGRDSEAMCSYTIMENDSDIMIDTNRVIRESDVEAAFQEIRNKNMKFVEKKKKDDEEKIRLEKLMDMYDGLKGDKLPPYKTETSGTDPL